MTTAALLALGLLLVLAGVLYWFCNQPSNEATRLNLRAGLVSDKERSNG